MNYREDWALLLVFKAMKWLGAIGAVCFFVALVWILLTDIPVK
jgi:hypothetical protein